SLLHHTATTGYPCCVPTLGDSPGAGCVGLARRKGTYFLDFPKYSAYFDHEKNQTLAFSLHLLGFTLTLHHVQIHSLRNCFGNFIGFRVAFPWFSASFILRIRSASLCGK